MKFSLSFLNGEREGQLKCFGVFLALSTPLIMIDVWLQYRSAFLCLNLFMGILSWTYLEYPPPQVSEATQKERKVKRGCI